MSNKNNVKGLLKGLKYISHIFEEEEKEEEQEIQIGEPTDVKHVAHIGWDGPAVSAPAWMDDFKSDPNAPQQNNDVAGDINSQDSASTKKVVKDSTTRDLPAGLPKSRRQPCVGNTGSTDIDGSSTTQKPKPTKKKHSKGTAESSSAPTVPKKTRKTKHKDNNDDDGSSIRTKDRSKRGSKHGPRHASRHGSDDDALTNDFSSDARET